MLDFLDKKTFLIIMVTLGVLLAAVVVLLLLSMSANRKKQSKEQVFVKKGNGGKGLMNNLYEFFEGIPPLRRFMRAFGRRYDLVYPGDKKESALITIGIVVKIFLVSVLSLALVFGLNPGVFNFITALLMIYFFSMEIVCSTATKIELRFLKEFDEFLSAMKHYYYQGGQICDAIFRCAPECSRMMRGHASQIYDILNADDVDLAIREYMSSGYHKYLKLFLSLCQLVNENGDVKNSEGVSVFMTSIMQMRNDVQEDSRYIREKRNKFMGLTYIAGLPVIAVPYIAQWCVSTIPALVKFYNGLLGFIIKVALLIVTYVSVSMLFRLREGSRLDKQKLTFSERVAGLFPFNKILNGIMNRNYGKTRRMEDTLKKLCEKYTVRTFYMHRCLLFVGAVVVMTMVITLGHMESRRLIVEDTGTVENLSMSASSSQIEAMCRVIPEYTQKYIDSDIHPTSENREELISELAGILINEKGIRKDEVAETAATEVINRVQNYDSEVFDLKDMIIIVICALLAYAYPSLQISFRKSLSENSMQDEVMQFQSIIHMLKEVPGVSAVTILEEMEHFAEIFRPSIQQCLNEYGVNDIEAFERLYLAEDYPGFRKIVDCFMTVDEVGVTDAFDEISAEIVNFKENRKLERKLLLEKEGRIGSFVSIVPGGLIIFGYLLAPFMVQSLAMFSSYSAEMNKVL